MKLAAISIVCLIFAFSFVDTAALHRTLASIRPGTLLLSACFILASVGFAFVRFRCVLKSFGYAPDWRDTFIAFSFGQASNLTFLNIIGQSLSRAAVLSRADVPGGVSIVVTYWERGLAAAILLVLSLAGGWFLIANSILTAQASPAFLIYLFASIAVVAAAVIVTVLGPAATLDRARSWAGVAARMWPSAVLTLISQICMLAAYLVILVHIGGAQVSLVIISAITVIMFASSLPISFSGWGVRELGSVQILGAIGIGSAFSVTTAITIGLISLAVVAVFGLLGVWLFFDRRTRAAPATSEPNRRHAINWTSYTALLIGLAISVLIFFQVRIAANASVVTANMADVLALTALAITAILMVRQRNFAIFPPLFSWGLVAVSGLLALAFLIGWSRFGLNQWALTNRGVGWVIILGYVAAGGALAWVDQKNARVLVMWCFALAGAAIAAIELALQFASLFDVSFPAETFVMPLRGYAGNSNAFAFQMIMTAVAAITVHRLDSGQCGRVALRGVLVLTAVATYFSLSRAGLGTFIGMLVLVVLVAAPRERRQRLFDGLVVAVALMIVFASPWIVSVLSGLAADAGLPIPADPRAVTRLDFPLVRAYSDEGRWQSIVAGWQLWTQYPLFGGGLGAFAQSRVDAGLPVLIIHSVPVWILAELGLFGLLVVAAVFVGLLAAARKLLRNGDLFAWGGGLIVLIAAFAVSGLVHDFFYQRTFWFLFGICAGACAPSAGPARADSPQHAAYAGT